MMKIVIVKAEDVGKAAFEEVKKVLCEKPDCTLGLATGSSPLPLYREMIRAYKDGLSYRNVTTYNLDEYVGLPKTHDQSYYYFMHKNLFSEIDLPEENTHIPDGTAPDMEKECARYSALLSAAKIDLQVLGIGGNGHIAFNEPGTPFTSKTHTVTLTEKTVLDNARFFDKIEDVPRTAVTMGIGEILKAKKILLIATGKNKADAVYKMIKGPVDVSCPASSLRDHPDVTVVLDEQAAAKL